MPDASPLREFGINTVNKKNPPLEVGDQRRRWDLLSSSEMPRQR